MKTGLDDFFARKMGGRLDIEALVVDTLPGGADEWVQPIPFDDPTGPPFPVEDLPPRLREYALAVAEDTGAPVDLCAWCALAAIGAATRGRYVISPKPSWREPIQIQSLQVVASGGGKSPAYNAITEPLKRWDSEQAAEARKKLGDWKVKGKTLAAAERLAQREADKLGAGTDAQLKLEAVQKDIVKHEEDKPFAKHIIVNDITPQAFWKFLYRQEGSGAAFAAEGEFFRNVNRYGDAPIWEPVLKGFSGDSHDLRRAGDDDDDGKEVSRPIVAISLAVQPQVLEDMGQVRGFRELGVSARLLTTFPRPVPTRAFLSVSVPEELQAWWTDRVKEIANQVGGSTYSPGTLSLSSDAQAAFENEYAWYARAEAEGVFLDMEEWGRKYRGQVLRIAGTLHVLEESTPLEAFVSGDTMRRAIVVMRHAIDHARIAHGIMLGLGTQSNERYVLGIIDDLLEGDSSNVITSAQVYDRVRGRYTFRKASRVLAILQSLEEHRFIRLTRRDGPGPRSYTIARNPIRDGCEDAKLAPQPDINTPPDGPNPAISQFRSRPKALDSPDIAPVAPLAPTGTDDDAEAF